MTYNPPQYALDHLASLKVGDKAVLLEPANAPEGSATAIIWNATAQFSDKNKMVLGYRDCPYFGLPNKPRLPNGVKVKVLSVKLMRCDDLQNLSYDSEKRPSLPLASGIANGWYIGFERFNKLYPGAWERNDWFWVAEIQVVD